MTKVIFFEVVFLCMFYGLLGAEETIEWYIDDSPPCHINQGKLAGQGFCDKIQADIIHDLSSFNHVTQPANWNRILVDLKTKQNICKAFIFRVPERESYMAFSNPVIFTPSSAVIFMKANLQKLEPYITSDRKLNLNLLLKNEPELLIGVIKSQTYGPDIEPLIGPLRKTPRVFERSASDYEGLIKMLSAGRLDIALMVPLGVVYYQKFNEHLNPKITALPILGARNYHAFHVGCSKRNNGEKIIDQVNSILVKRQKQFDAYRNEWMDSSTVDAFELIFAEVRGKMNLD